MKKTNRATAGWSGPCLLIVLAMAFLLPGCASADQQPPAAVDTARNVIYYDNFDYAKGEWQQVSGFWETLDGHLIQKTDDPRQLNAIRYILTPRIADATIETEVRVRPDRPEQWTSSAADEALARNIRFIIGAGIIFRMQNPDNYYMFRLAGEEGAVLGRMIDGQWNEQDLCNPRVRDFLEGSRIGFRADNWYRLKVEAYANRLIVYINDEPVCSAVDNTFSVGGVGLVTFKTAADFDYIKVTR
ncbi:MAG: hypothetical protein GY856_45540 [bacterium]|nr:hypothetical protein [bacterium]